LDISAKLNVDTIEENEDTRILDNAKIILKDNANNTFVYDVAIEDLLRLEDDLLKMATYCINKTAEIDVADRAYVSRMREKISGKKGKGKYHRFIRFSTRSNILESICRSYRNPRRFIRV
jgi:hypothetical protein